MVCIEKYNGAVGRDVWVHSDQVNLYYNRSFMGFAWCREGRIFKEGLPGAAREGFQIRRYRGV